VGHGKPVVWAIVTHVTVMALILVIVEVSAAKTGQMTERPARADIRSWSILKSGRILGKKK
jgi:hypothetical protein